MENSAKLEEFLQSIAGPQDPRELAYDVAPVLALDERERQLAEDALISRAVSQGDLRAIESLGVLGCLRAGDSLKILFNHASLQVQSAARRVVFRLHPDADSTADVVEFAQQYSGGSRLDAAFELARAPTEEGALALYDMLGDRDPITRWHAMDGLKRFYGLEGLSDPLPSVLGVLDLQIGSDNEVLYRTGLSAMRAYVDALRAGATANSLNLIYKPPQDPQPYQDFLAGCDDVSVPLNVAAVRAMQPQERRWAEQFLLARLHLADVRGPQALVDLRVRGSRQALEFALKAAWDPAHVAAINAALAEIARLSAGPDQQADTTLGN